MCPAFVGGVGSGAKAIGRTPSTLASYKEGETSGAGIGYFTIKLWQRHKSSTSPLAGVLEISTEDGLLAISGDAANDLKIDLDQY